MCNTPEKYLKQGIGYDLHIYKKYRSFIKKIEIIDYDWSDNTSYREIWGTFQALGRDNPKIFIINKADLKNNEIELVQVIFGKEDIE